MKWKNLSIPDDDKVFDPDKKPLVENFETQKEFKKLAKKYHPDLSDEFFKKINEKRLKELNRLRDEKRNG